VIAFIVMTLIYYELIHQNKVNPILLCSLPL